MAKKKKAAKKAKKVTAKKKTAKKTTAKKKAAKKAAPKKVAKKAVKKTTASKKKKAAAKKATPAKAKKAVAPTKAPKAKASPKPAKPVREKKGPGPSPDKKSKKATKAPAPVQAAPQVVEEAEEFLDEDEEVEGLAPEEVILTDDEGRRYCRRRDCDQLASVEAYCRYHYLLYWKKIQQRKKILSDGKLIHYIEELTSRYPDKYLEMIGRDLRTEKDFLAAIQELEIDESAGEDGDYDEDNSIIDEVRGMSETSHSRDDDDY